MLYRRKCDLLDNVRFCEVRAEMQTVRRDTQPMEGACLLVNYKIFLFVGHYGLHMSVHGLACCLKHFLMYHVICILLYADLLLFRCTKVISMLVIL
jgi:hypothetical protein